MPVNRDGYERRHWHIDVAAIKRVLIDRDLDAGRFPSPLSWISAFKSGWLGGVRATLDLDIFNAFNYDSTLRQFTDAITTTHRSPLEIVVPRVQRFRAGRMTQ